MSKSVITFELDNMILVRKMHWLVNAKEKKYTLILLLNHVHSIKISECLSINGYLYTGFVNDIKIFYKVIYMKLDKSWLGI